MNSHKNETEGHAGHTQPETAPQESDFFAQRMARARARQRHNAREAAPLPDTPGSAELELRNLVYKHFAVPCNLTTAQQAVWDTGMTRVMMVAEEYAASRDKRVRELEAERYEVMALHDRAETAERQLAEARAIVKKAIETGRVRQGLRILDAALHRSESKESE